MTSKKEKKEPEHKPELSETKKNLLKKIEDGSIKLRIGTDGTGDPPKKNKKEGTAKEPKKDANSHQYLLFDLDYRNRVYLTSEGQFYLSKYKGDEKNTGKPIWVDDLKFSAPLMNLGLIKQGEKWKIKYAFDKEVRQDSIDTMLSLLAGKLKLDTAASKLFAQFIYKFKTKKEEDDDYEIAYEPITVMDGVIKVNRTTDQPAEDILKTLIDMYSISTNPDSFLITLLYNVMAPFSYEIRMEGHKFPYRMLAGKTHGGKTSESILIALKGFDQPIKERKESINTVKTIFTFGQQVEKSRLPFVIDDITNEWLKYHAEELKGATDGVKFMARGTKAQTQTVYDMVGMSIFTLNEEPTPHTALRDRIILSSFTSRNAERQNKSEWERLSDQLKSGFMFNLIKEMLDGKPISEVIKKVHKSVKKDEEINKKIIDYSHELLSGLARKYNLKIPDPPQLETNNHSHDLLELFCTFVATRCKGRDRDGATYQKFSIHLDDKERKNNEMRITSMGYNDFIKEYKLQGLESMTNFINELKDPSITIEVKWVSGLGKSVRCIIVPFDKIFNSEEEEKDFLDEI